MCVCVSALLYLVVVCCSLFELYLASLYFSFVVAIAFTTYLTLSSPSLLVGFLFFLFDVRFFATMLRASCIQLFVLSRQSI